MHKYRQAYPNLSPQDWKLFDACRIATAWSQYTSSLTRTRTLGTQLLKTIVPIPDHVNELTQALHRQYLMQDKDTDPNVLHYLDLYRRQEIAWPEHVSFNGKDYPIDKPAAVMCRNVGYHSDDVDSDTTAYVFWYLGGDPDACLMYGGNAHPLTPGDMLVFDARVPHALLKTSDCMTGKPVYDEQHPGQMNLAMIATTPMTPELCQALGIENKGAPKKELPLQLIHKVDIDTQTGQMTWPSMG